MADTLDVVVLDNYDDWTSMTTLTKGAIQPGEACVVQVQSYSFIQTAISGTKPAPAFRGWLSHPDQKFPLQIPAGENLVWFKGKADLSIQKG